jgi:hypothetical protein
MGTYEIIKAIPAKGFDWTGFSAALRALVIVTDAAKPRQSSLLSRTLAEWSAAKGMREIRYVAQCMAAYYADDISKRQNIIPPSDESKMWDSFEGGHNDVWNDRESMVAAEQKIAELAKAFRK